MSTPPLIRKAPEMTDPRAQKRTSFETAFSAQDYYDIVRLGLEKINSIEAIQSIVSEKYWKSHRQLIKDVFFKFSKREITQMMLTHEGEPEKIKTIIHKLYLGICYNSNVKNFVRSLKRNLRRGTNYLDIILDRRLLRECISGINEYLDDTSEIFFVDDLVKKKNHLTRIKNAFLLTQNGRHAYLGISWGRYNFLDPALELLNPENELALSDERLYNQLQVECETIQNNYILFRERLENVSERIKNKIDELSSLSTSS